MQLLFSKGIVSPKCDLRTVRHRSCLILCQKTTRLLRMTARISCSTRSRDSWVIASNSLARICSIVMSHRTMTLSRPWGRSQVIRFENRTPTNNGQSTPTRKPLQKLSTLPQRSAQNATNRSTTSGVCLRTPMQQSRPCFKGSNRRLVI